MGGLCDNFTSININIEINININGRKKIKLVYEIWQVSIFRPSMSYNIIKKRTKINGFGGIIAL